MAATREYNVYVPKKRRRRSEPATHALVVGVSRYRHFPDGGDVTPRGEAWQMGQLTSAARSASLFAKWLMEEYRNPEAPLQTLRLLLSPGPEEKLARGIKSKVRKTKFRATRENVQNALSEFRDECEENTKHVAIVYVVGHGVQVTRHGARLLLEDVGSGRDPNDLDASIDTIGCHEGLDHGAAAATQFWFVDTCRQPPAIARQFSQMRGGITLSPKPGTAYASPLFFSASAEQLAFARPNQQTLFCEALLGALSGDAMRGPDRQRKIRGWHVTTQSLSVALESGVKRLAGAEHEEQSMSPGGRPRFAVVHRCDGRPLATLELELEPRKAQAVTNAELLLDAKVPIGLTSSGWPLQERVESGMYLLNLTSAPPWEDGKEILSVSPSGYVDTIWVKRS